MYTMKSSLPGLQPRGSKKNTMPATSYAARRLIVAESAVDFSAAASAAAEAAAAAARLAAHECQCRRCRLLRVAGTLPLLPACAADAAAAAAAAAATAAAPRAFGTEARAALCVRISAARPRRWRCSKLHC